ncbi:MAG: TatD family hydrolase [Oscillospiraceae bacterium]|nr:TatD family hydrolase [Oscillospiraceae bacterium]
MFTDTHAHYDDEAFDADRDELLAALPSKGIDRVIVPGCSISGSRAALALAERFPYVFAACGIHPEDLPDDRNTVLAELEKLVDHPKCVAVGEIGLDYYWDKSRKEEQKDLFRKQLSLAVDADLPVIIHDREAHADSFDIVSEYRPLRGVFHCYSGSAEMAAELLKMGWYLGFDGPVTYKNARKVIEVIEICPPERILLETDSPYLSPAPVRGRRNDSSNLGFIAEKIAEIKGLKLEELAGQTSENACRLFGI